MELIIYPNPILSQKCDDVKEDDPSVQDILHEMSCKLYEWNGAGLAAPQVGVLKRIVVVDIRAEPQRLYKMINPKIIWKSEKIVESKEGCLSLPILREVVKRHESVVIEYWDENFARHEEKASDFLSFCFQHELDHLDGILYIDHLSRLKKARTTKKFEKLQKENEEQ
ncbi:MAG: peptide deformylase [Holosporaceae bacterium]|jgi:peptide deformylase|nr:peptide deformylase [Holosporaceae bacterium]